MQSLGHFIFVYFTINLFLIGVGLPIICNSRIAGTNKKLSCYPFKDSHRFILNFTCIQPKDGLYFCWADHAIFYLSPPRDSPRILKCWCHIPSRSRSTAFVRLKFCFFRVQNEEPEICNAEIRTPQDYEPSLPPQELQNFFILMVFNWWYSQSLLIQTN